jgi:transcriptional regulator with XRE-family HTH domain
MENWIEQLPDELKTDPNVAKYKTPVDLVKGHVEAVKFLGTAIRPPGPDASPEDKKAFIERMQKVAPDLVFAPADDPETESRLFKQLGRPDKPEDYAADEETAKAVDLAALRELAKTAGMTKKQFAALAKAAAEEGAAKRTEAQKAADALKAEWGAAHAERVQMAAAVAEKLGLPAEAVKNIALGQVAPAELKFLHAVAQALGTNPKELSGPGNPKNGALTPAEAKLRLEEIRGRDEYWNPQKNPAVHARLVEEALKLTEMTLSR